MRIVGVAVAAGLLTLLVCTMFSGPLAAQYAEAPGPATRRVMEVWGKSDHWSCHTIRSPLPAEDVPRGASYFAKFWEWFETPGQQEMPVLSSELGLRRLTNETGDDINADWSPDGSKIVWVTDRLGNWTIWVMNSDGGSKMQLTNESYVSGWPKWSPDGGRILYWGYVDGQSDLWLMNPDGTGKVKVMDDEALEGVFAWSPDGAKIAYNSNRTGNWEVWTVSPSGGEAARLTERGGNRRFTAWSPDGAKISYYSCEKGVCDIWLMNRDGSDQTKLTSSPFNEIRPVYSPDLGSIAYLNFEAEGFYSLWMMAHDGSNKRRLTEGTTGDRGHSYHPAEEVILFWAFHEATESPTRTDELESAVTSDLFSVDLDGELKQITVSEANDMYPSWSPDGELILFESDRHGDFDLFTLPRAQVNMDVVIRSIGFQGEVYLGEELLLDVEIDYVLEEETYVWVAAWDRVTDVMLSSETAKLVGSGTEAVGLALAAPEALGEWNLRVEAWYQVGSEWSHSPEGWFHNLSIRVIPEFGATGAILLIIPLAVFVVLVGRRLRSKT